MDVAKKGWVAGLEVSIPAGISDSTAAGIHYYALEVQQPFSRLIISGEKSLETRAYPLPEELIDKPILLMESIKGEDRKSSLPDQISSLSLFGVSIIGTVVFDRCVQYTSLEEWEADRDAHRVEVGSAYDWRGVDFETAPSEIDAGATEVWGWHVASAVSERPALETGAPPRKDRADPTAVRLFRSIFRVHL